MRLALRLWLPWAAAALALPVAAAAADDWTALLDAAWSQRAAAADARRAQGDAARAAAAARTPEPPSLTLAGRGDRVDPRRGAREWEAEVAAPLWWPDQRDRALAVADAERTAQQAALARERWQLAGELREAAWSLRLMQAEAAAAAARESQARRLAEDVERRVRAGDQAPLSLNQARAAQAAAVAESARADAASRAAEQRLAALVPDRHAPRHAEWPAGQPAGPHPLLDELEARHRLAQAHLTQATRDRRDAPEVALSVTRERDHPAEPWRHRARLALRVPLGDQGASLPRQAAATAEHAEARLALELARRKLAAERLAAEAELDAARRTEVALAERATLAMQSLAWVEQAFRAGQLGVPALLQAAAEQAQAQAQAARAAIESARAVSRLNQTLGSMP